jgi:hypothetical protein
MSNIHIDDFMARVRPFDLIVFRNTGFIGKVISFVEWLACGDGRISHVGCVINLEVCPIIVGLKPGELGIFESNVSGSTPDVATGKGFLGVQVRNLRDVVVNVLENGGSIGWCPLIANPCVMKSAETKQEYDSRIMDLRWKVAKFYHVYSHMMYDLNPLDLLGGAFSAKWLRRARDRVLKKMKFLNMHEWMFCSELVALLYIVIGVITDASDGKIDGIVLDPANVIPVDFISGIDADGMISPVAPPVWISLYRLAADVVADSETIVVDNVEINDQPRITGEQ